LTETAYLVEAVARERGPDFALAPASLRSRALRVLEIFERLERAEQMGR
jgi:hypothetical protein